MRRENWTVTARREASGAITLRARRMGADYDGDGVKDAIWPGKQLPTVKGMVSVLSSLLYASPVGEPVEMVRSKGTMRTIRATMERGR